MQDLTKAELVQFEAHSIRNFTDAEASFCIRSMVPSLLDEVRRLRAENAELRAAMEPAKGGRLYAQRDSETLGAHYFRHVEAMTTEGLHEKSAIAGELAWRDAQIAELRQRITVTGLAPLDPGNEVGTGLPSLGGDSAASSNVKVGTAMDR